MGKTVLVVDDDPSVRRLLTLAFRLEDFTVFTAATGEAALDAVHLHSPAVVVLDAVMPGIDGMEVCRRLRATLGWGPTVVMVTGRTDVADRLAAVESGADDYVVKPVRVVDLVERVKGALRSDPPRRARQLLGGPQIYEELRRMAPGTPVAVSFIEVRGIRPFNHRYSFARGERFLRFVGELLLELTADRPGALAGRLGAEEFLVVTAADDVERLSSKLVDAFNARRQRFYDPLDAERGWVEVTDRAGQTSRHRLLALAVGVASNDPARPRHHLDLLERAAELAKYARSHGPVAVDRRHL